MQNIIPPIPNIYNYNLSLMKKQVSDMVVVSVEHISRKHVLIKLTQKERLPEIMPGQFVEVKVDGSPNTFLRRPI